MKEEEIMNALGGMIQSKTVWLGGLIVSLPDWWPLIQDQVQGLLGSGISDKVVRIMGILVILVRFFTKESLSEKGAI